MLKNNLHFSLRVWAVINVMHLIASKMGGYNNVQSFKKFGMKLKPGFTTSGLKQRNDNRSGLDMTIS